MKLFKQTITDAFKKNAKLNFFNKNTLDEIKGMNSSEFTASYSVTPEQYKAAYTNLKVTFYICFMYVIYASYMLFTASTGTINFLWSFLPAVIAALVTFRVSYSAYILRVKLSNSEFHGVPVTQFLTAITKKPSEFLP